MRRFQPTRNQTVAYRWSGVAALLVAAFMLGLGTRGWWQPGPDNIGHETIECDACHLPAAGTLRQQLQANARHWLGLRESGAPLIHAPVGNRQCLDCHENPNDLHPVYRFNEPRFADARAALAPQYCGSCHRQHQGVRAAVDLGFCRHCHQDTRLEDEPLDVSHEQLAAEDRWNTCLGCHDFHGNHEAPVPTRLAERLSEQQIRDYLEGGRSPYGHRKLTVMQTMKVNP